MEDCISHGTHLDHFAESEELLSVVSMLPVVCGEMRPTENAVEKFTSEYTVFMHVARPLGVKL